MHTHTQEIDALVELERNVAVCHPTLRKFLQDVALSLELCEVHVQEGGPVCTAIAAVEAWMDGDLRK